MEKASLNTSLSRNDSALLKGLAIFAIFLHNYCHWMPQCINENEYDFNLSNTQKLVDYIANGGPHLLMNIFSYFGHYGVPVFLFVSGYGLVKTYERQGGEISVGHFLVYNALKLWRIWLLGVGLFIISETIQYGAFHRHWIDVAYLVTYVSNFLPKRDLLLGPWWYFSLTLQCYLIYRLIFYRWRNKSVLIVVTVLCVLACALAIYTNGQYTVHHYQCSVLNYLRYNFVGSMLPFAIGIWSARYGIPFRKQYILPALVLFLVGCFNAYLWLLTPLFLLALIVPLTQLIRGRWRTPWEELGSLSAALFVVHPIVRPFLVVWARAGAIYPATISYILIALLAAWLYRKAIALIPKARR